MCTTLYFPLEVEALQGNGNSMQRIQDDIEMLVSAIEQTTHSMSRLAGSCYIKHTSCFFCCCFLLQRKSPLLNCVLSFV